MSAANLSFSGSCNNFAGDVPVQVPRAWQPAAGAAHCVPLPVHDAQFFLPRPCTIQDASKLGCVCMRWDELWGKTGAVGYSHEDAHVRCREQGIEATADSKRGFDHGAFVPLLKLLPKADVPVVAMSLISGLDPKVCRQNFKFPLPLNSRACGHALGDAASEVAIER